MSDSKLQNRGQEPDDGPLEYKFHLIDLTEAQKLHLASQMKYRLTESEHGQVIYDLGLTDDGFPLGLKREDMDASVRSLREIVENVGATICAVDEEEVTVYAENEGTLIQHFLVTKRGKSDMASANKKRNLSRTFQEKGFPGHTRYVCEVIIRKDVEKYWEIKVGIAGNVDCGKSSLLGVLVSGENDNGRGRARMTVMKHKHEQDSGRTSAVAQEIVGFDDHGESVNKRLAQRSHGRPEWDDIIDGSSKIVTFFDLAGHLSYLPQTISGITSNDLDYTIIVVGANMNNLSATGDGKNDKWISMTKEHMGICLGLGIQVIVAVTKIDNTDPEVRKSTVDQLDKALKKQLVPFKINTMDEVRSCVERMDTYNRVVPIIQLSNVTGEGMDLLRKLLHYLPPRKDYSEKGKGHAIMQIQEVFRKVEGTSIVIAGMLTSGSVHIAEGNRQATAITIGPFSDGSFLDTKVRTIHVKKMSVAEASAGKYICIGLPKAALDKGGDRIRKGMFAVSAKMKPKAVWEFWADVRLARNKSTCIKPGYTPSCHIGHIKQTCKLLEIKDDKGQDKESMSAGEDAKILMRFCFRPELLFSEDKKLVFREGKTKGIGTIIQITDTVHTPIDNKTVTKDAKTRPTRSQRRAQKQKELAAGVQFIPPRTPAGITIKKGTMEL